MSKRRYQTPKTEVIKSYHTPEPWNPSRLKRPTMYFFSDEAATQTDEKLQ